VIYREIEELQGITLADYIKNHNSKKFNGPDRELYPKPQGTTVSNLKTEGVIHEASREGSDYPSHSEELASYQRHSKKH
jgi:hypothetical protein